MEDSLNFFYSIITYNEQYSREPFPPDFGDVFVPIYSNQFFGITNKFESEELAYEAIRLYGSPGSIYHIIKMIERPA